MRRSDCSVTLVVGSVVPNINPVSAMISPPHDNHRPCYRHHLRHNHHHFQHHRQPSPLPEVLFSILVYSHFGSSQALLKQCLVPIENKGEMGMGRDSRERVLMAFSSQRPHGGGALSLRFVLTDVSVWMGVRAACSARNVKRSSCFREIGRREAFIFRSRVFGRASAARQGMRSPCFQQFPFSSFDFRNGRRAANAARSKITSKVGIGGAERQLRGAN